MDTGTPPISRRRFIGLGIASGGAAVAATGALTSFLWPRGVPRNPADIVIEPADLPAPGAPPLLVKAHRAWIVKLPAGPDPGAPAAPPSPGGYLVVSRRCSCHPVSRGCTVSWMQDFEFRGARGWFTCPCHASIWSRSGTRVKGRAATALETFPAWTDGSGRLHVDFSRPRLAVANTLAVARKD